MPQVLAICCLCCLLLLPASSRAEPALSVTEAWARESPPGSPNGAVYLTLHNRGKVPDRFLGASGAVATAIELHTVLMEDQVMKMRRVDAMPVPPGLPVVLKPSGPHLMLIGLTQPLRAGQSFPVRCHFEHAGEISVDVTVRPPEGQRPSGPAPHDKHH